MFDLIDAGPLDGPVAVLLHGWPGGSETWRDVAPLLNERGIRTLTPDQRGYSPGARPRGVRPYTLGELTSDVVALLDAYGLDRAHIVGHDWGGAVAWALGASEAERVESLTVLSTPHPAAMVSSMWRSDQALRSSYMAGFQIPLLAERVLLAREALVLRSMLERSGLPTDRATEYCRRQSRPGALESSLAWYRAVPLSGRGVGEVDVPTTYVWSANDAALGRRAAELSADHVTGPYRFEELEGVSHWIPETEPALAAQFIVDQVTSAASTADA